VLNARFVHPLAPDLRTEAVALDISQGGCALELGPQALPLVPGMLLRSVEWFEDGVSLFHSNLDVRHVSPDLMEPYGLRVGCAWSAMAPAARRLLNNWIERGGNRGRVAPVEKQLDMA
jgi:c-di-GMP-binding flagellar brake protein YcgR